MIKVTRLICIVLLTFSLAFNSLPARALSAPDMPFGEPRWHTIYNNFKNDAVAAINGLSNLFANWVGTVDTLTLIETTPTFSDDHTFTLTGDFTAVLPPGKRLVADCGADGLKPNTVASCTYGAPNSTVVVNTANLTANLEAVSYYATRNGVNTYGSGDIVASEFGAPSWTNLQAAIALANSAGRRLLLTPGAWPVTDTIAIAAPVHPVPGATFAIATIKTLSINGPLEAGLHQIFSCIGTGKADLSGNVVCASAKPEWWGGKGDNSIDSAAAIQAALTSGAPRVEFQPNGIYKANSNIEAAVTALELIGYNTTINTSANTGTDPHIFIHGSAATSATMGSNPVKGATSFICAAIAAVATPGDKLLLQSTDQWCTATAYYLSGEFVTVHSVSGTTVNLMNPLYDGYTGANTTVYKPALAKVAIRGIKFVGPGAGGVYKGLEIGLAQDVQLRDVESKGYPAHAIYLNFIYSGDLDNVRTHDYFNAGASDCYGLILGSAQNVTIHNSKLNGYHHGLVLGGGDSGTLDVSNTIPNRNVDIGSGNVIDNNVASGRQSLNSHGNGEIIRVHDCTIANGSCLDSINTSVINCDVFDKSSTSGIQFSPQKNGNYCIASNNRIYGYQGIVFAPGLADIVTDLVQTNDNTVVVTNRAWMVKAHADGDTTINHIVSSNDRLKSTSAVIEALWVGDNGGNYPIIGKLFEWTGGSVVATAHDAALIYFKAGGTGLVKITGGYRVSAGTRGVRIFNVAKLEIDGAHHNSSGAYDDYNAITNVNIRNSTFTGYTSAGGLSITGATQAYVCDNDHSGATGVPSINVYAISFVSSEGNRVFYRPTVPAAGTFVAGDRVINSSPSVGQPKSWVYTIAATWVSEGDL